MGSPDYHLEEARKGFKELQTTRLCTSPDDLARYEGYIHEGLKQAGALLPALDPTGRMDEAGMRREIEAARKATCLRSARHQFEKLETTTVTHDASTADFYVSNIRKLMAAAGLGLPALDPGGKSSDAEIEERFRAGKRRLCLQKARSDFAEFENSTCDGWGDMTDSIIRGILKNVDLAGESIAALDPTGQSGDADVQKRFDGAETRLRLMFVQSQLTEAETAKDCYTLHYAFAFREKILKTLALLDKTMPGIGLAVADASGKADAAQVEARLTKAEKRLCKLGALRVVDKLEKYIEGAEKPYAGAYLGEMRELEAFLAHTGGQKALAEIGSAEEKRISGIITTASFRAGGEELEAFEKMSAPKSLKEIDDRAERIACLFNRASSLIAPAADGTDAPVVTVQERLEEAGNRARALYYAAGGKLPVMKRIKLAAPRREEGAV